MDELDYVDEEDEEAEREYWLEREREKVPCECPYCVCFNKTDYGGICYDCANHAHQG